MNHLQYSSSNMSHKNISEADQSDFWEEQAIEQRGRKRSGIASSISQNFASPKRGRISEPEVTSTSSDYPIDYLKQKYQDVILNLTPYDRFNPEYKYIFDCFPNLLKALNPAALEDPPRFGNFGAGKPFAMMKLIALNEKRAAACSPFSTSPSHYDCSSSCSSSSTNSSVYDYSCDSSSSSETEATDFAETRQLSHGFFGAQVADILEEPEFKGILSDLNSPDVFADPEFLSGAFDSKIEDMINDPQFIADIFDSTSSNTVNVPTNSFDLKTEPTLNEHRLSVNSSMSINMVSVYATNNSLSMLIFQQNRPACVPSVTNGQSNTFEDPVDSLISINIEVQAFVQPQVPEDSLIPSNVGAKTFVTIQAPIDSSISITLDGASSHEFHLSANFHDLFEKHNYCARAFPANSSMPATNEQADEAEDSFLELFPSIEKIGNDYEGQYGSN